ncbi:nacht nucleoside triphosphatase [Fusarium albosuccineum]|uniref:Nacht nucleoside triphosphatase n=1 Tax=Fusarium albosuccineum TaxID=1237068 RepID=A0A8H4P8D0_9HYPO|nr:nacht nucleoside triphosphatase [Fusarium albosuccineum]
MDPVSALGIASASAQFITFASSLISTTAELYDSATEAPGYSSNLNAVYSQLQKLCQNLNQASQKASTDQATPNPCGTNNGAHHNPPIFDPFGQKDVLVSTTQVELLMGNTLPELQSVYSVLQDVLRDCEQDSNHILTTISKLRIEKTAGALGKSFKAAFKLIWKRDEIKKIDERLKRSQAVLIATMSRISNIYHVQHSQELAALRKESQLLGAKHSEQLSDMQNTLQAIQKDGKSSQNVETFEIEVNSLEKMMRQFSLSESRVRTQLDIIRSLNFKTRQLRHNAIPKAHQETFQWVFSSTETQKSPKGKKQQESEMKLLNWLEHGSEAFWVSGKPGSGKSTFMKFVADHPKTVEALTRWSHPFRPIISSCFFWSSGTEMQKSLTGLLQTLLHNVFQCCPQLVQKSCPSRWSGEISRGEKWTEDELRGTLQRISKQPEMPFKFCFFIDGLDEYDGDHIDFCEYLETILSQNIKLCLSSRPWNVFTDAFGGNPASRIFIHELTWNDILLYAEDRLHRHPRWNCLVSHSKQASSLAEIIATRAQGVFLWVFLVTRLLREGLTNDDGFADLERRLSSFPAELESFFKQMLESVPSFYHEKMAGALKVALYAMQPLDAMIYSFLDDEYEDENYWQHLLLIEQSSDWVDMRQDQTVRRLNGRCRGLLENQLGKIEFLHRTVADFLRTSEMSEFLDARSRKGFNPGISILKGYTAWLKTSSLAYGSFMLYDGTHSGKYKEATDEGFHVSSLYTGVRTALRHASYLELDPTVPKSTLDSLVDEIDSALSHIAISIDPRYTIRFPDAQEYVSRLCRILALDLPLMGYLSRKLRAQPSFLTILNRSPISIVLWPPTVPHTMWPAASRQKLELVLQAGSNPNESILGAMHPTTIWARFLSEILPSGSPQLLTRASPKFQDALEQGLIQTFLDHGANPKVRIWLDSVNAVSAFTLFVAAAFDIDWHERAEEMYFQSLDSFIDRGASLDKSEDVHEASPFFGLQQTLLPSTTQSTGGLRETFFDRLRKRLDFIDDFNNPQRLFIAKLVRKIIPCAREACWPLAEHQRLIDRVSLAQRTSPSDCWHSQAATLKRGSEFLRLGNYERESKRSHLEDVESSWFDYEESVVFSVVFDHP